jgi:tRNA(fMet)-specific endonuclease VapC
MPSYLLDTNAAISLLAKKQELTEFISSADGIYISSVVLGELYYGAEKSARILENVKRVDELAAQYPVLNCDARTASIFGRLRRVLERKGRPNQANDIWIAATALQYSLTLLTRDADFNHVDNLTVQSW